MIKIGDTIPLSTLALMQNQAPTEVQTDEFFGGKKTLLFALPGAFTPTCSKGHLPGFVKHAEALKAKGIDQIACLSVNDAFVMNAWGEQHNANDKILMLADGSAKFTQALGLQLDLSDRGFGIRSQRYCMLINDRKVEQLRIEEGGNFEVSSAEVALDNL